MDIRFLGTGPCMPTPARDTASYLIDRAVMVDTGWFPVRNLLLAGVEPTDIRHLLFTHMHHDHMMGLPSLLYCWLHAERPLSELHLYGPEESLERAVRDALRFLQTDAYWPEAGMPTVHLLPPEGELSPEGTGLSAMYTASLHAVPGRCYVFEECGTGARLGLSGDTAYQAKYASFFAGCDVLAYEYSLGHAIAGDNRHRHASALVAAQVAQESDVRALMPVHGPADTKNYLAEMRAVYDGPIHFPRDNEFISIPGRS